MTVMMRRVVLNEKVKKDQALIDRLEAVPLGRMYQASFKAVVRMHLFITSRTHELFYEFAKQAQALVVRYAGKDQVLDGTSGYRLQTEILSLWGDVFKTWSDELEVLRRQAALIPFGVMAVTHERMVRDMSPTPIGERVMDGGVFEPQLDVLLNAAGQHLYGDSLNVSQRVWRIDRDAREGMTNLLLNGISSSTGAWELAEQLEQYLGANAECPRWTSTRLYGKTKSQIATGDTGGLLRGDACDGRGVSYNALRLARTEIQKAHALATDKVLASQPWVEKEKVNLSAAHPEHDICDETAGGGEGGQGIYPVGEIELPLHPNCLCYKTAVLMDADDFASRLRGWMNGTQEWGAMDEYAELVGGDVNVSLLPSAIGLAVWLFGDAADLAVER